MGLEKFNCLLLRGLGRESEHWGQFKNKLEEASSVEKVFTLDLAGTGSEFQKPGHWQIEDVTDDLRKRFVSKIKSEYDSKTPVLLVAISFGAMVAMNWAAKHSDDFQGLVLINTSDTSLSRLHERLRLNAFLRFFQIALSQNSSDTERLILKVTSADESKQKEVLAKWQEIAQKRPVKKKVLLQQLWMASRFVAPQFNSLPKLFVSSGRDQIVNPECSRKLAEFYGSECVHHEEAGHDIPLDATDWLVKEIEKFSQGILQ